MKAKANNPRQITKKRLDKLAETLTRLGDLSGIVHNEQTDNIVGGNQRSRVISIADCEIEIVHQFDKPDEQGTTALGYALWRGKRYVYRRVSWPQVTEDEACIVANHAGGIDDMDKLANEWDVSSVLEWAGMDVQAWQDEKRVVAGWGEMLGSDDANKEWEGMPEFSPRDMMGVKAVIVHFNTLEAFSEFCNLVNQDIGNRKAIWYPPAEILKQSRVYEGD